MIKCIVLLLAWMLVTCSPACSLQQMAILWSAYGERHHEVPHDDERTGLFDHCCDREFLPVSDTHALPIPVVLAFAGAEPLPQEASEPDPTLPILFVSNKDRLSKLSFLRA